MKTASPRLQQFFLTCQFLLYFAGISFSTGGGNYPGLSSNNFIYLKGACMVVPFIGLAMRIIAAHRTTLTVCGQIISRNRWMIAYLALAFLSIPLAVAPFYSLQRLFYMLIGIGGIFALIVQFMCLTEDELYYQRFAELLLYLSTASVIFPLCLLVKYGVHDLIPGYRFALQSYLLIHPNLLASFYAHLAVFHLGYILYFRQEKIWIHQMLLAILLLLIVLLFSRAVFISSALVLFATCFYLYCLMHKRVYLIAPLAGLALSLSAGLFLLLGSVDIQDLLGVLTRGDDVASLMTITNRTELWQILLQQINVKTALVGNGFSVMTDTFGVDFGTGILYGAHNAYLSVFLGTGVFSLLCLLCYFTGKFIRTICAKRQLPVFSGCVLFSSFLLFALNCLTAEEIGMNTTVTCAYLIFIFNILLYAPRYGFEHSSHRL